MLDLSFIIASFYSFMDKDYEIEIEVMDVKGYKKTSSIEMRLNKKDVEDYFGQ